MLALMLERLAHLQSGPLVIATSDRDLDAPIATLLEENKKVIESMKKDGLVESESVIVSTYLERIRKDGVPKNSDMKHRVDSLVNNNTMIVVLLSKYLPRARTAEFRVAALKFTDYAAGFRDRWQSIFEIFMVGGRVPSTNEDRSELLTHALERELSTD